VRRIFACVLVLGTAGLGGLGVLQCIAQSDAPALTPDQFKPLNLNSGNVAPPSAKPDMNNLPPAVSAPNTAAMPNVLPALPSQPPAMPPIAMPSDVTAPTLVAPPAPVAPASTPAPILPPASVPSPEPVAPAAPIVAPTVEPLPAPIKAPAATAPAVELPAAGPKMRSDGHFMSPVVPDGDSSKTMSPATTGGNRVTPSVSIETIAPDSVSFDRPLTYEIVVKNTGPVAVAQVRVDEEIGQGAKFISAEPAGDFNSDKAVWMIGSLSVGEEKHIKVTVKPGDSDLCTKPRVSFAGGTAMNVRVTRPSLVVTAHASEIVQVGDDMPIEIQVTNNGTGDAARIVLKAVLSEGLVHGEGKDIQALLKKLAPGESEKVTLRVQAGSPGLHTCSLLATTEGAPAATSLAKFDIRQPKLTVAVTGPTKCMVRAEPTFTLEVANPGNSATEPVQVAIAFAEGLDFVSASDGGAFDPTNRSVIWNLPPAPAGTKKNLSVKVKSTMPGQMSVRTVAKAGVKLVARAEAAIHAEGVPAISFDVVDAENPVEVGKETIYEIRLKNTGTMDCTNLRLSAALSIGLEPTQFLSSVAQKIVGQTMVFDPIVKLPVKGEMVIMVKARGKVPGDHRFKVQLSCDQLPQPVVKEQSTSFYQP
jgi:uncharacterized repeat protein (TIGR01451 family)